MYELCDYIVDNVAVDVNDKISFSILSLSDFDVLDKTVDIISQCLNIDKTEIDVDEGYDIIISCRYKNRLCKFFERFGSQRDYIVVEMFPV